MSTAASSIINRVRTQLIDTSAFAPPRFTDAELLQWLSDGQRTIVAAIPRSSQKLAVVPLVAGTRQSIPADGYMYLTAYRNMGASGATPGLVLVETQRTLMDTQYPTWHSQASVPAPSIVVFDPSDPKAFYVSPPSDGTGKVELSYSGNVVELVNTTDLLTVQDIWATPLFDYAMYRCCQKDSDYAPGQATGATYLASFTGFLQSVLKDHYTAVTQAGAA